MTKQVYTTGYGGKKTGTILNLAKKYDAIILDIRYSPRSRNPDWSRKRMQERMGERYIHAHEFGNINYRGGPIRIVDYDAGKAIIEQSDKPVILVCVCKDAKTCHRTTIAHRLRAEGFEVVEIGQPPFQLAFLMGNSQ